VQELYSNTLTAGITALITFAAVFSAFYLLKSFVGRRARTNVVPPSHLQELFRDSVKRTRLYFILVVALWVGSLALTLNARHEHIWHLVVMVAVLLQAGVWAGGLAMHRAPSSTSGSSRRGCAATPES
jgi:hypothetical protein